MALKLRKSLNEKEPVRSLNSLPHSTAGLGRGKDLPKVSELVHDPCPVSLFSSGLLDFMVARPLG